MYAASYIFLVVAYVMCGCLSKAENIEELQDQYKGHMTACMKDITLTPEDMAQLQKKQMPDKEAVKCMFACVLKMSNMMDESGMFSIERSNSVIEKYFANDPDKKEKGFKFTEACKSVNDVPVSDGEKGCERAALLYKCTVEKAAELEII